MTESTLDPVGDLMPRWDHEITHSVTVNAGPDIVWHSLTSVTAGQLPVFRLLIAARRLPGRVRAHGPSSFTRKDGALVDSLAASTFTLLASESPSRLALGTVGQFWRARAARAPNLSGPADFINFDSPGYAKALISFELRADGAGTRLVTRTRVVSTDARARRKFAHYWRVIHVGSAAIRLTLLRTVRKDAERRANERTG